MESPLNDGGGGYAEHHDEQDEDEQTLIQLGDIVHQQQVALPQTLQDPHSHLILAPPLPAAPQQTYGGLQLEEPTGGISTTLLVTNLPYRIRWQDLKDLFRRYGTPTRADVFLAPDGRSRGVGMVSMRSRREAENCVADLNGYEWFGRKIGVKIDETGGQQALAAAAMAGATIWEGVGVGFSTQADYEALSPHLQPALYPTSASTATTATPAAAATTTASTGATGGVTSPAATISSVTASYLNPATNAPSVAAVGVGVTTPQQLALLGSPVLFVGNLPFSTQWQDLKDLLRPAGRILRADIALAPDGRSKGWGTAVFATPQEAQHAIDTFDGWEVDGRIIKVRWDKFQGSTPGTSGLGGPGGISPVGALGGMPGLPSQPSPQLIPTAMQQQSGTLSSPQLLHSQVSPSQTPRPPGASGGGGEYIALPPQQQWWQSPFMMSRPTTSGPNPMGQPYQLAAQPGYPPQPQTGAAYPGVMYNTTGLPGGGGWYASYPQQTGPPQVRIPNSGGTMIPSYDPFQLSQQHQQQQSHPSYPPQQPRSSDPSQDMYGM